MGVSNSFQPGINSSKALVSKTFPLNICAPISDAFSNKQIFNSELSCFNLIAVASPDGPPPTITTSYSIVSLDILNFLQIILFLYSV